MTSKYFLLLPLLAMLAPGAEPTVSLDLGNRVTLDLVLVQPGSFQQGSPVEEVARGSDETLRSVKLTQPFYLGKTEVTRGQFAQFVKETNFRTEAEDGKSGGFGWDGAALVQRADFNWRNLGFPQTQADPVGCVMWLDAHAFCRWLSERTGRDFSLPWEAQWEYAARAGSQGARPDGEPNNTVWTNANALGRTHPAGQKPENAWGFEDMLGNQWEWCEDWYAPYPDGPATDPLQVNQNLSDKPRRVLRGGSWVKEPKLARYAARFRNDPRSRNADNGFRVMTLNLQGQQSLTSPQLLPTPIPVKTIPKAIPLATPPPAPSPPPSNHLPPVPQSSSGVGGWLWALLVIPLLAIVAVVKRLLGRPGSPPVPQVARDNFTTTPTSDGFWLEADTSPGSRIRWTCLAAGQAMQGVVEYEPGPSGQFIFTGAPPQNIDIVIIGTVAALGAYTSSSPHLSIHSGYSSALPSYHPMPMNDEPPAPPLPEIVIDPMPEPPANDSTAAEPLFPSRSEPSAY